MEPLQALSQFSAHFEFGNAVPEVQDQARYVLLDTVGAIIAGSAEPEMAALSERLASGVGPASVIGTTHRAATDRAALLNGTAGTFMEMDEGNRFSRGHPGIHVIPAVLAYAEAEALSGSDVMSAMIVGYEVGSRVGYATNLRGSMHPHGTWGTVGAAAAIARLARFDETRMRETINVASSLTLATSKRTMLEGGLVRNVYAGISNQMGLLALTLVESGFSGECDGLRSVFGSVVSDSFEATRLNEGLGSIWHIQRNYFKRHSCCRYNHGALDALDRLIAARGPITADAVARVEVTSYLYAAELNDQSPRNTLAGKFSVPFAIATRLVNGSSGVASFTWDAIRNPAIQALAKRVTVHEDPAMTNRLPEFRPARVEVVLKDGGCLVEEIETNRGDDADPYSRAELRDKFHELSERVYTTATAKALLTELLGLAQAPNLSQLSDLLNQVRNPKM